MKALIIIICLLMGFGIGINIETLIQRENAKEPTQQPPPCICPDSTLVPAIHRLTDAILAGTDTMVQESNETQAIWKEIQERHYSPY